MGLVVGARFGEVPVAWEEDVPFADVDGRILALCFLLFPDWEMRAKYVIPTSRPERVNPNLRGKPIDQLIENL